MERKIKICGLSRPENIEAINKTKADYAGFVVDVPFSSRSIDEAILQKLAARLDPQIVRVGVFVDEDLEKMARLLNEGLLDVIQLHGSQDETFIGRLQQHGTVWRAFQVRTREDLQQAALSKADLVLLDAGAGNGKRFDWSLLDGFSRPYLLAGGIGLDNLEAALATGCMGVDVSSQAETDHKKDPEKIMELVQAVKAAG